MKKLTISFLAIILSLGVAFSQPVSDMGIIPVGVTLNSILRLNVTSGGNLEYSINTMSQYTSGVAAGAPYITTFTVASSVDFNVDMYADAATFTGVDQSVTPNTMLIDNLGYEMAVTPGATGVDATDWNLIAAVQGMLVSPGATIIAGINGASAGDITQNDFTINWRFGTMEGSMNAGTLLSQDLSSDRYVVNVAILLSPM
ncbi:MAG: hypothetical protein L3J35_07980 [Bacteroidales bacterium]|nr:hypothetical protein [Bacteroidales bacterium]